MLNSKSSKFKDPKSNFWAIVIGVVLLFGLIAFAVDEAVAGKVTQAKIVGLYQGQEKARKPPVLIAELANGQRVILAGSHGTILKKGTMAKVQRYETRIMGRIHYRFISYLE